jgi:hypothetical protein
MDAELITGSRDGVPGEFARSQAAHARTNAGLWSQLSQLLDELAGLLERYAADE